MTDRTLSEPECRAVFLALVEAQDGGLDAARSPEAVAGRFTISEGEVRRIEREGIDGGWPPLA